MLMGWLGRKHKDAKASAAADLIQKAVTKVIADGKTSDARTSAATPAPRRWATPSPPRV